MPAGRPTTYTEETAAKICEGLSEGKSLRTVCREEGMPALSTIFLWLKAHPKFSEQYAIAKDECADALVEDMLDIADNQVETPLVVEGIVVTDKNGETVMVRDNVAVNHAKLRVDTRKLAASKLKPKKYGDRQIVDQTTKHSLDVESMEDVADFLEKNGVDLDSL